MKKSILSVILCTFLIVALCGCNDYKEPDNGYMVTALGFDGSDQINVFVEVVTAGGTERSSEPVAEILEGSGKTPTEAVFSLNSSISKHLVFEHCTAVILGQKLTEKQLGEILEYGRKVKEINFAVDMFICENPGELLKNSESVAVARGFDISGNLNETNAETGIDYENRFYEIYSNYKAGKNYSFPILDLSGGKIIISGQAVFGGISEKTRLDNEESLIYSFLSNLNDGGKIYIGKEYADMAFSHTKYFKEKECYEIDLCIKKASKKFCSEFEKRAETLLREKGEKLGFKGTNVKIREREGI